MTRLMDYHLQLGLARTFKFVFLLVYASGIGVGLTPLDASLRKKAVHLCASPALIGVWLSGYVLTLFSGVSMTELWVLGGFLLSLAAHLTVTRAARAPQVTARHRASVIGLLTATLCLMVFRPTWWSVRG